MQWQGHNRFAGWPSLQRNSGDPGEASDSTIIRRLCIIITNVGILMYYRHEAKPKVNTFQSAFDLASILLVCICVFRLAPLSSVQLVSFYCSFILVC